MVPTGAFFSLEGKVAVVTGGGQGIGEAICRRLAAAGARVAVFDRETTTTERVASDIGGLAVLGDVTNEKDIARAVKDLESSLGPIDIVVNNAGIVGKAGRIWELSKADLEIVLDVNLVGPFL